MSLIQRFLQCSLKIQIYIGISLLSIACFFFIFSFSLAFILVYQSKIYNLKKQYFDEINQKTIKDFLLFQNLCLHQYEQLIKLFNYKTYSYLYPVDLYLQLIQDNSIPRDPSLIEKYNPNVNYPIMNRNQKIFFFCGHELQSECDFIYDKVEFNARLALLQGRVMDEFRVSFYGDFPILDEYLYHLLVYKTVFSANLDRIKQYYIGAKYMDTVQYMDARIRTHYQKYKKYFDDYVDKKLNFLDIMFSAKYYVFSDYAELIKNNAKEEYLSQYLKKQSINFHYLNFSIDSSILFDGSEYSDSYYICQNTITDNFVDFLLIKLSRIINLISIPSDSTTNKVTSRSLCLFLMIKQYIQIKKEITSNDVEKLENFLNEKKATFNIDQCKLEKYMMKEEIYNDLDDYEFNKFFDLEYQLTTVMYSLLENDQTSEYFSFKFSFPDFNSLYNFKPSYFIFDQLNLYSFISNINMIIVEQKIGNFYLQARMFCILCLVYLWILTIFIIAVISTKVVSDILKPINKLQMSIESKLNPINKNENEKNIFEFKIDDTINSFFEVCKKIIEGDIKSDNELFSSDALNTNNTNSNINSNLITNHRLIADLKKNSEKENFQEKNIYIYDKYYFIRKDKRKKSRARLISNDSSELNDKNKNKIEEDNIDIYKDLFLFSELVSGEKEANQNQKGKKNNNKMLISLDHGSKIDHKNKNKKSNIIDNKYITYHWYKEAKENFANTILNYYDNKEYSNFFCK